MIDVTTEEPLQVRDSAGGPLMDVPVRQLEEIQGLLDKHSIRYWVDEDYLSWNGGPEMTIVYFGRSGDAKAIQSLLDSVQ